MTTGPERGAAVELSPAALYDLAGHLALECRLKDSAIANLERALAAVQTENASLRSKLDAVADDEPGD